MYDPNSHVSIMSNSPNRLLNIQSNKLRQTSQPQNPAKKLKVNHTNGIRSTLGQESHSIVRSTRDYSIPSSLIEFIFILI